MPTVRTPTLDPIAIEDLRPTQITVGLREVEAKRKRWRGKTEKQRSAFFGRHMIPVIQGPKKRHYIIDHHHLARVLHEEGVTHVLVSVVANLSRLEKDAFWVFLDNRSWTHPYDAAGRRRDFDNIPKSVSELAATHSEVWPVNFDGSVDLPRTRLRSANSCGPISCVAGLNAIWLKVNSPVPLNTP